MANSDTIDPLVQKRIQEWLDGPYDEETKQEIRRLAKDDPKSLSDAFYTDLSFGTAGLRGIMGVGTNRMNQYIIRLASQGLANYILKQGSKAAASGVLIGFDSRHHSEQFAQETAQVLAGNGIKVYLLKELRPTPYVSFACRFKKCTAAVMITASHNPAIYNGYKVYWSDGGQIVPPHDTGIMQEVKAIQSQSLVKLAPPNHPLIEIIGSALDQDYIDAIAPLQHFQAENKQFGSTLKISYTSLHGTGITMVPPALKHWGFNQINYVEKQIKPDPDFPTVPFPNPEYKETLTLGIEQLLKTQSDILMATDPDADRMGVVVLHKGKPEILTGNEIGSLCVDYLCEILTQLHKLPRNGAFVTTIVSTELIKTIAASHQLACFEVLTGFKYIGEKIHEWETNLPYQFLFGAEESYGFLLGTQTRDKDAIVTSCLIAEMALFAKRNGQTLVDRLHKIYRTFGLFKEKQYSLSFEGSQEDMEKIAKLMKTLRKAPPQTVGTKKVVYIEDYLTRLRTFSKDGKQEPLTLPKSDVLLLRFEDESKLVIRPSGTEPKLKLYAAVRKTTSASIDSAALEAEKDLDQLIDAFKKDLHL